jgi:phosphonate dehydrogenase
LPVLPLSRNIGSWHADQVEPALDLDREGGHEAVYAMPGRQELEAAIVERFSGERPRVVLGHPVQSAARAALEASCDVHTHDGQSALVRAPLERATAVMAFMTERIDSQFLSHAPDLQIVAGALKGFDNIDVEACSRAGVWVTVCEDTLSEPTADLAVGLLLGLARRISEGDALVRRGEFRGWRPRLYGADLRSRTLGIIGMGAVGRAVAERAASFGVRLLYWDARPLPKSTAARLGATRMNFESLVAQADILMPLLPLNATTRSLIDAKVIERMPRGALIINVARGSLVDEEAIAGALRDGRLGGYAADVFACEDLSMADRPRDVPESLIAERARTLLTPHLGSAVASVREAIELEAAVNVLAALAGQTPPGAINTPVRVGSVSR